MEGDDGLEEPLLDGEHDAAGKCRPTNLFRRIKGPQSGFLAQLEKRCLLLGEKLARLACRLPLHEGMLERHQLIVDEALDQIEQHYFLFTEPVIEIVCHRCLRFVVVGSPGSPKPWSQRVQR